MSCNTCTDCLASGSRPDLSELIRFRARKRNINISREVGYHCYEFGHELLKGHMRQVLPIIRKYIYQGRPEHVNLHILLHWLEGKGRWPVTWRTLVETLKDIGLNELAREIRYAMTTTSTADEPPPTPTPGMMSMCCVGTCVFIGCFGYIHVRMDVCTCL